MTLVLPALVLTIASVGPVPGLPPAQALDPEAISQERVPDPKPQGPSARDALAGGRHWRLTTARGPVHVWRPAGLDLRTAGILVYVHGYYTGVDEAWARHRLAEQFGAARRNAILIVPEAPVGDHEKVHWTDLGELLEAVRTGARLRLPPGPVVAMGHSGGFRTLVAWLGSPRLEQVILLDGLYNNEADFAAWLAASPPEPASRRLVLVAFETTSRSEAFVAGFPDALVRDSVPESPGEFLRRERQARLLYLRSQYDHMGIVTAGRVIPVLARLAPFRPL